MTRKLQCAVALLATGLAMPVLAAQEAVSLAPENPRYLEFRNRPLLLLSASEHYGSVINRPFDYEKYLTDAADHKMTMTRTFLLYRELQSARNPSSPCKPESPDYISPFLRKGPGKALDGEPIYDLDEWNPEYFSRLHRFLDFASKKGIVVELTVFSNTYSDDTWALNPFKAENNRQHVGAIAWQDYISLKDPELVRRQKLYARKIIQETAAYDNVYYEICNEPGGGFQGHASASDVDAWQAEMASVMRDEMKHLHKTHLLAGQQAFTYGAKNKFPMDDSYSGKTFDIVNDHPLPNTLLGGQVYDMGNFMSKELRLAQVADFCRATVRFPRPSVFDEDNTASIYRDLTGWTIHRKRAWTAALNGCQYDYIDFSITVGNETGTVASQAGIRSWMQHLSEFMASFDYVHAKPAPDWVGQQPKDLVVSGLEANGDYVAYLGDAREVDDAAAGKEISGTVSLTLPAGKYDVSLYSPATGLYSPAIEMAGGAAQSFTLSRFHEDIVIRARRR